MGRTKDIQEFSRVRSEKLLQGSAVLLLPWAGLAQPGYWAAAKQVGAGCRADQRGRNKVKPALLLRGSVESHHGGGCEESGFTEGGHRSVELLREGLKKV